MRFSLSLSFVTSSDGVTTTKKLQVASVPVQPAIVHALPSALKVLTRSAIFPRCHAIQITHLVLLRPKLTSLPLPESRSIRAFNEDVN